MEAQLDKLDNAPPVNDALHRSLCVAKLESLYEANDSMLRQKSRLKWSPEGDRNTRFFHQSIQKRRQRNKITKVLWLGSAKVKPPDINSVFFEYFSKLFGIREHVKLFGLVSIKDLRFRKCFLR